jgi:hypothetical protein
LLEDFALIQAEGVADFMEHRFRYQLRQMSGVAGEALVGALVDGDPVWQAEGLAAFVDAQEIGLGRLLLDNDHDVSQTAAEA